MKLGLALGAAVIATTVVAYASTDGARRHFQFHRMGEVNADTNGDGWLSREEAAAQADRLFADLDRDNNGSLTERDQELLREEIQAHIDRAMEGVHIQMQNLDFELEGLDEEIEAELEAELGELRIHPAGNCTTTTEQDGDTRRTTIVCREGTEQRVERRVERAQRSAETARRRARRAVEDAQRHVRENVRIVRNGQGQDVIVTPAVPPIPPVPATPGPIWVSYGDDEADLNGDGALSREEFRAQQLRFFDARDANGDGRIRYEAPPAPPEAPEAPQAPRRR